jgi:hypothetical protein
MMLSVIIPAGKKSKFTELLCKHELKGIDSEIIMVENWEDTR